MHSFAWSFIHAYTHNLSYTVEARVGRLNPAIYSELAYHVDVSLTFRSESPSRDFLCSNWYVANPVYFVCIQQPLLSWMWSDLYSLSLMLICSCGLAHFQLCPKFISSCGSNRIAHLQSWRIPGSLSHVISQHTTFFSLAFHFLANVSLFRYTGANKRYQHELAQRGLSPHFLKRISKLLACYILLWYITSLWQKCIQRLI